MIYLKNKKHNYVKGFTIKFKVQSSEFNVDNDQLKKQPTLNFKLLTLSYTGFTLIELLLVIIIMGVMVTFVVPRATHSIDRIQIDQVCADLCKTTHYALDQASTTGQAVRLVMDIRYNIWVLEKSDNIDNTSFKTIDGFAGQVRKFGDPISLSRFEGFTLLADNRQSLMFNPRKEWPQASFHMTDGDSYKVIKIDGKTIHIEEDPFVQPMGIK